TPTPNVNLILFELAIVLLKIDGTRLLLDTDNPNLFALERERLIVKPHCAARQTVDKLLERVVIKLLGHRNANHISTPTAHIFDADKNVGVRSAPPIRETKNVRQKL